jgi:hypothetical protein
MYFTKRQLLTILVLFTLLSTTANLNAEFVTNSINAPTEFLKVDDISPSVNLDTTPIFDGLITTVNDEPVEGVEVTLSGDADETTMTNANGSYILNGITANGSYTVTPQLDTLYKNGVSTFDLVFISRHILTVELLDSPYKLIAADIDNSGSISVLDVILLRRLILSVDDAFEHTKSWRFVEANYVFPDPTDPWLEPFPEVIDDFTGIGPIYGDFIAIKVGDVSGDASPNFTEVEER